MNRDCYQVYLKPQQRQQLINLANKIPHCKRLVKALINARLRIRPQSRMTREARAEMVADDLQESLCELETLQEEMSDWIAGQKETSFKETAQYQEVMVCENTLGILVGSLEGVIKGLQGCKFPGWKDSKNAVMRHNNELRERRA